MKTRKQKVIFRIFCTIVSIFLLASFFAVPVSALDEMETFTVSNQIYEYGESSQGPNDDLKPYSSLKLVYGEDDLTALDGYWSDDMEEPNSVVGNRDFGYMRFGYDLEDNVVLLSYFIDTIIWSSSDTSISKNDTLVIESGNARVYVDSDYLTLTKCRFSIKNAANNYDFYFEDTVAATDIFDVNINSDTVIFSYPDLVFNIFDNYSSDNFCLCIEFLAESPNDYDQLTDFFVSEFNVKFGVGKSPNYPIYPSAPGKNDVDGLGSAEHELIQSQQQGINAGLNVMGDTSTVLTDLNTSLQLGAFATQLSGILDKIVTIPGIDALVQVSLALGLFASLMALSASIISAADRKAGKDARDTKQQERARTKSTHRRMGDF